MLMKRLILTVSAVMLLNALPLSSNLTVSAAPTPAYSVVLPTSTAWNFTLDPQGLETLGVGDSASFKELYESAGTVIPGIFAPEVKNNSNVPVKISVAVSLTGQKKK